jgi:spermidine synthase
MTRAFAELGFQSTPLGDLSLRRRRIPSLDVDVCEVKLGEEYLMSSLFTESERELGRLGVEWAVAACPQGSTLSVIVGGLGLGYTAQAVLSSEAVASLVVVELFGAVIDWHREGLVPIGTSVVGDPRCRVIAADFFAAAASAAGFDPDEPGRRFDAILVDIDHTPDLVLDASNAELYTVEGLSRVAKHLRPAGVFGVWSDHPPDPAFLERLETVFATATARPITFDNPLLHDRYTQTVYLAGQPRGRDAA